MLLRPPNFHHHCSGWLPPNQHRDRGVLQCSQRSFWMFPKNCPSLFRSGSHLNAMSFDPDCMHGKSSRVGDTARPPPRTRFPTRKRQDFQNSRYNLGTVALLSETVATISLSAAPTVTCSEQLVHFKTART